MYTLPTDLDIFLVGFDDLILPGVDERYVVVL